MNTTFPGSRVLRSLLATVLLAVGLIPSLAQMPDFAVQPASRTNNARTAATFTVTATGADPLSYRWCKEGVPLANGMTIAGAATPSLTISNVLGTNSGNYTVVVSNSVGSVTSAVATLTVIDPLITVQSISQQANSGSSVTFSATAVGTTPLSFQWWKDGVALAQQTNSGLTLASVQSSDAGSYTVVVANIWGATTSAVAILTVSEPPITGQPAIYLYSGSKTTITLNPGLYFITVYGAQGGASYQSPKTLGAEMAAQFHFTTATTLTLLVGGAGGDGTGGQYGYGGGGGGGSFVVSGSTPLVVAGGAGGSGTAGRTETSGGSGGYAGGTGGENGNGGQSSGVTGGGGGFSTVGGNPSGGGSFLSGGVGGGNGGFGGGGGGAVFLRGGGGGGYSGGGGGGHGQYNDFYGYGGGGGGPSSMSPQSWSLPVFPASQALMVHPMARLLLPKFLIRLSSFSQRASNGTPATR